MSRKNKREKNEVKERHIKIYMKWLRWVEQMRKIT